jgi:hypothetical protein
MKRTKEAISLYLSAKKQVRHDLMMDFEEFSKIGKWMVLEILKQY